MPILSKANLSRAWQYMKRNGIKNTYYAAKEEIGENRKAPHEEHRTSDEEAEKQREQYEAWKASGETLPDFSILVPLYHTPKEFLFDLMDSVRLQTYGKYTLVLADAGEGEGCEALVREYVAAHPEFDAHLTYSHLAENAGISANTNAALELAKGNYISLLDHDDVLTFDCLYRVAEAILACAEQNGEKPLMIYTDEDKCNGDGTVFYENNRKPDFNRDYLLSNNYICHFLTLEAGLFRELRERSAFDGSQDFDLVLRVFETALQLGLEPEKVILHVPEVLYHWRCHENSTAANPHSKDYAYDAGQRAIEDCVAALGWKASVVPLRHKGFYRVEMEGDIFAARPELGAVGGRVLKRSKSGRVLSGALDAEGKPLYAGMPAAYSGEMHRAVLTMNVEGLDLRCLRLNPCAVELFERICGVPYTTDNKGWFCAESLPADTDYPVLSARLSRALRDAGFLLLYDPDMETIWKK